MDKTVAGLIGAVAALSATSAARAAIPAPQSIEAATQAASYADLLKPIPNALDLLRNSAAAQPTGGETRIEKVQLVVVQHHHHHHYRRRRHYHHHHHHHHHSQD